MPVLTTIPTAPATALAGAAAKAAGPACSLQRTGSLWQLGIEAQEARSDVSRADALEESLVLVLTRLQPAATRFSFPNHELTSRRSQAVEIDDEEALATEWLTVKTTSQPDKAAIKEALKAGQQIPGAQLISRRSWRIT